jgi:hypothetical protein
MATKPRKVSEEEIKVLEKEAATAPVEADPGNPMAAMPEDVDFGNEAEAEAMAKVDPVAVPASNIPRPASPPPRAERPGPRAFNFPSRRDTRLPPGKLKPPGHSWRKWDLQVPVGTKPEQVLDPVYFGHYIRGAAMVLSPLDEITVLCEDLSWEASYRVLMMGEAEVIVSLIGEVSIHTRPSDYEQSDVYEVRTIGNRSMVIHRETKQVVKDNLPTPSAAHDFIAGHLRSLRR